MKKLLYGLILLGALTFSTIFACNTCNNSCENNCGTCCTTSCNSCCSSSCCNDCDSCLSPCSGYPFLLPRSQGRNSARELVGWQEFINRENKKDYSGAMYAAVEYTSTFKPCQIAQYLFGADVMTDCCSSTLLIQGSGVANRNPKAWLADYFGLAPDFESSVSFCPKIQNAIVDLNFFLALDKWAEGLFVRLDMPIAWTQTDLGMYEVVKQKAVDPVLFPDPAFAAGYMASTGVNRSALPDSFTQAMAGTTTFGDMQQPIKFGRMTNCKMTKAAIADLRGTLGYNFVMSDKGHFGLYGILAAPTGNKPTAWYLLEPMVGNGHHWELGGGLTSSWIFHRCTDDNKRGLGLWFDATVSHLFKSKQCRSFDFNCSPNSRYMLLAEMGANKDGIKVDINNVPTLTTSQYQRSLIPAINWSTMCVDVSIGVQADLVLKMGYFRDNWNFDIGYDFWARSGEKFCQDCCGCNSGCNSCCNTCYSTCVTTTAQTVGYALKGDAYLYGDDNTYTVYPISATEHAATIYSGTNLPKGLSLMPTNTGVDNPYYALNPNGTTISIIGTETTPMFTSQPSVLVSKSLLNMCKSPSSITHKIFANISYAWKEADERWLPFLGIGGEAEFAQGAGCCKNDCGCNNCCNTCNTCPTSAITTSCTTGCNNNCNSCCNDCCCPEKRASISQWGIWLKGGVKFD